MEEIHLDSPQYNLEKEDLGQGEIQDQGCPNF